MEDGDLKTRKEYYSVSGSIFNNFAHKGGNAETLVGEWIFNREITYEGSDDIRTDVSKRVYSSDGTFQHTFTTSTDSVPFLETGTWSYSSEDATLTETFLPAGDSYDFTIHMIEGKLNLEPQHSAGFWVYKRVTE